MSGWTEDDHARYERARKLVRDGDLDALAEFLAEDMSPVEAAIISAAIHSEEADVEIP